ncbi:MAG TPA: histidine phosphatase family protein [Firmicutes bacterium]|nr:histidine phosphatase family protein [Bacillota bacterium]
MIVYITRHGQIDPTVEGEREHYPLTPLGRIQATKLGHRLRELGFNGLIYTSPFHRCLETTEIICRILNAKFYPEKLLREVGFAWYAHYRGLTVAEIAAKYPSCSADARLPWPWWPLTTETDEQVIKRVLPLAERLRQETRDVLLVGHGGTTDAMFYHLAGRHVLRGHSNASLSAIRLRPEVPKVEVLLEADTAHLGKGEVTHNMNVVA